MIKSLSKLNRSIRVFSSLFSGKNFKFQQTFTYYVPAPPTRKTGYQEKEFDFITQYILALGFELIDLKVQAHSTENSSGMWIVCILGTNDEKLASKKINLDFAEIAGPQSTTDHPMDPDIIHEV